MKKLLASIASTILLISNVSCSSKKVEDVFMLEGNIENESMISLEIEDLKDKIENKESFVLVISLLGCSSCESFAINILNPYIKKNHASIYNILSYKLDESTKFENKPKYKVAPTIVIYRNGIIENTLNYDKNNDVFEDNIAFENYINNYVIKPNLVAINEEYLDKMIENEDSFTLYIGWNKCGDCKLLDNLILNDYLLNDSFTNPMYYLESDKYRSKKPSVNPHDTTNPSNEDITNWDNWINFATKYNFVSYRDGKVPVLQYYQLGKVQEMLVFHNDKIENGIVSESFFSECIEKKYTEEKLLEYHTTKVLEFLEKYFK